MSSYTFKIWYKKLTITQMHTSLYNHYDHAHCDKFICMCLCSLLPYSLVIYAGILLTVFCPLFMWKESQPDNISIQLLFVLVLNFSLPPLVNLPVIFISSFILVIKRKCLLETILSCITKILVPKIKISATLSIGYWKISRDEGDKVRS